MLDWSRVLSWLATPDHVRHCYSSRGYRAERREVGGQAGRLHLVEILGLPQALKPPGTEASEADTVREGLEHRRAHGGRHDDLTAVCRGADTRGGMHREADVACIGEGWTPAVNADPHPHVDPVGPCTRAHRPLDRQRGLERRRGSLEAREEPVRAGAHRATTG